MEDEVIERVNNSSAGTVRSWTCIDLNKGVFSDFFCSVQLQLAFFVDVITPRWSSCLIDVKVKNGLLIAIRRIFLRVTSLHIICTLLSIISASIIHPQKWNSIWTSSDIIYSSRTSATSHHIIDICNPIIDFTIALENRVNVMYSIFLSQDSMMMLLTNVFNIKC